MAMLDEVKQNLLASLFQLVWQTRLAVEAETNLFQINAEFDKNKEILLASVTDEDVKTELKGELDQIKKHYQKQREEAGDENKNAFERDDMESMFLFNELVDRLDLMVDVFNRENYISREYLMALREQQLAHLYDSVNSENPGAFRVFLELLATTIPDDNILDELKEKLKKIDQGVNQQKRQRLPRCKDALERHTVQGVLNFHLLNSKLESIVEILQRHNLIETGYTRG